MVMGMVKNFLPDADSLKTFWHVECQGVWRIAGGMYDLVKQIETISKRSDASFFYKNKVKKILMKNNKINGIELKNNKVIDCDTIIFNGDPKALFDGLLGSDMKPWESFGCRFGLLGITFS